MSAIDVDAMVASMSDIDVRRALVGSIQETGRLTAAIKARHPLAMGKGDGAIDAAIDLIESCRCR